MRKLIAAVSLLWMVFLLSPACLFCQVNINLKALQKGSGEAWVYRVPAALTEKFLKDSIDIDRFLTETPVARFPAGHAEPWRLDPGQYLFVSIEDNRIHARLQGISNIYAYPVNNRQRVRLLVIDRQGALVQDARVRVNGLEAAYDSKAHNYRISQRDPGETLVRVYTPRDTLFTELEIKKEEDRSPFRQRWDLFKASRIGRIVSSLYRGPASLFRKRNAYRYSYSRSRRKVSSASRANGMMVFSQPKYKPTDTVRLKAYLFRKNGKPFTTPLQAWLEYYARGQGHAQFLQSVAPTAAGSYILQFPLSDTLPSDIEYRVSFKTIPRSSDGAGETVLNRSFTLEDYLLDAVTQYRFRASSETCYSGDTLRFYASALDANSLSVLDGRAKLVLTASQINHFYPDRLQVPDTLYTEEKPLEGEGETTFIFPAGKLPDADLAIKASLVFHNGNNEILEKTADVDFRRVSRELTATVNEDSVFAVYRENGKIVQAEGFIFLPSPRNERRKIAFPFAGKVDPLLQEYDFYKTEGERLTDSASVSVTENYRVRISRVSRGDTLGFILQNPYGIPVSYSVLDGNKILATASSSEQQIEWYKPSASRRRAYRVCWQYKWKNEERIDQSTIALLYKLMDIDVKGAASVFPGQQDTLTVEVRDYHKHPVSGFNLTAVSYNSQFSKDINVPDPPYFAHYKMRRGILRNEWEETEADGSEMIPLGKHPGWLKTMGLDSLLYYKLLFPTEGIRDIATHIGDFQPQVSVHAAVKGERQEIYLLYINRELAYYSGVSEKTKDAYPCSPGYTKIGMRFRDRFIEIDSLYIQPLYKHDLFFDLDHLPAQAVITPMTDKLDPQERLVLEKGLWQLDNNPKTDGAYVWQEDRMVPLSGNHPHLLGPFRANDSLHVFIPGKFDLHFIFEPGYEYDLSPQTLRLEKKKVFPETRYPARLPGAGAPEWILGDTILSHPVIEYPHAISRSLLSLPVPFYREYDPRVPGNGRLKLTVPDTASLKYIILLGPDRPEDKAKGSQTFPYRQVFRGYLRQVNNIAPGTYTLLLIDETDRTAEARSVRIAPNETSCIRMEEAVYRLHHPLVDQWMNDSLLTDTLPAEPVKQSPYIYGNLLPYQQGPSGVRGHVDDKIGGLALAGAIVRIAGTGTGTATDAEGNFFIKNIRPGACTLEITYVGYLSRQVTVNIPAAGSAFLNIHLAVSEQHLDEVVVTALGISRQKKSLTYSFSRIDGEELSLTKRLAGQSPLLALEGKVAGLSVASGNPDGNARILLRGATSISGNSHPVYVIDGILYEEMPGNIDPGMIVSVKTLSGAGATLLYGTKALNGAIVITTRTKIQRDQFRDYAFWQPELLTDRNGRVRFPVSYPDNITGWETYILGMDGKGRMGKAERFIQAYKPLSAQISAPSFLVTGDTAELIGKAFNYTRETYRPVTHFSVDGREGGKEETDLLPRASFVKGYSLVAGEKEEARAGFNMETSTGFRDGEEKKIPVLPKGSLEAHGQFWILDHDTSIVYTPFSPHDKIQCYAQNNTLDLLLNELEQLNHYPFACMEQTASKLRGLLMERSIRQKLHQPFTGEKDISLLVRKLELAQLYEGSWSWWEKGKANLFITNYAIQALLLLRSDSLVMVSIRNGLLYLQNQLPRLNREDLFATLITMSEAGHLTDYTGWLQKIPFDSLSSHEQWQWIRIRQMQGLAYQQELNRLLEKGIHGFTGSLHWGEPTYRWHNDEEATTAIAFTVLQKEKDRQRELTAIALYFLEQRRGGYWRNTVESASIVSVLLPYILSLNKDFNQPARLDIRGDSSLSTVAYPYSARVSAGAGGSLTIRKTGGGLTYLGLYQESWNAQPGPVEKDFVIHSHFESSGSPVAELAAGAKIKMVVEVEALKEAEYVMVEIPIPGGCVYGSREQDDWRMHKEFLKNKVLLFREELTKGRHVFEIFLETRYAGTYTLNPAKVSLMYFPTFYGRNALRAVEIKP